MNKTISALLISAFVFVTSQAHAVNVIQKQNEAMLIELTDLLDGSATKADADRMCPTRESECIRKFLKTWHANVTSGKKPIDSCNAWAASSKGREYSEVQSGMQAAIESDGSPVRFYGNITQGSADQVVLNFYDENAIVLIKPTTVKFSPQNLKVKRPVYGLGRQTGTQNVTMTSGATVTIPVITAACISAN